MNIYFKLFWSTWWSLSALSTSRLGLATRIFGSTFFSRLLGSSYPVRHLRLSRQASNIYLLTHHPENFDHSSAQDTTSSVMCLTPLASQPPQPSMTETIVELSSMTLPPRTASPSPNETTATRQPLWYALAFLAFWIAIFVMVIYMIDRVVERGSIMRCGNDIYKSLSEFATTQMAN